MACRPFFRNRISSSAARAATGADPIFFGRKIRPLQHGPNRLSCDMHMLFANWIRPGILVLICAVLAGCVVDMGPSPRAQSMEAAVQAVLAKQGYYQGPIDGAIGPSTSRAIRNYQRDHHLTPTGTINPALAASMGLAGQANMNVWPTPYYAGYPVYYPGYAAPTYYAPPVAIGIGWGGGWPVGGYGGCWNRGWGGYGYRGWGGYGYRGYGGGYGRGWCR